MTGDQHSVGVTRVVDGLAGLAAQYDTILCDVWGVLHDGRAAFPDACQALSRFRASGGVVILITNAPRPRVAVLEQLSRLGAPKDSFDAVVTSGDVTLSFIAERGNAPLLHIGPERDLALFEALREESGLCPPRVGLAQASYVVCTGLDDDETETPDDYAERLADMRSRELDFVCANPDLVVHVGQKLLFCAGALAEKYCDLGGRVLQAGKPYRPIYERALAHASEILRRDIDLSRVLAIGDAMRTDIRGACDLGLDALFVTTGIHREEIHPFSQHSIDRAVLAQFLDGAGRRPAYAAPRLSW